MVLGLGHCLCVRSAVLGLIVVKLHYLALLANRLCTALITLVTKCVDLGL